jgi:Phage tail baseplate hub (GPD)
VSNATRLFPITTAFPLTPLNDVEGVSLICLRRVGAMDTARVTLNADIGELTPYIAAGSPLQIRWRGNGTDDEFTGYVHSYRPQSDGFSRQAVILAVSAAYPLFNESSRVFYRVGIHNVAEAIGDDHRLQVDTEPHPVIFDQVLQQDESDWAFLQRLATEWGYVLLDDGVRIIFRPLQVFMDERYRSATRDYTQNTVSANGSSLLEFKPSYSAVGRVPITTSSGQGVDPLSTSRTAWSEVGSPSSGIFQEVKTTTPVASELEANMMAVAQQAKGRFPFTATALVLFPAGKKPLDVYQITHDGSTLTWAIQSIKHVVTPDRYVGDITFGSDGNDYVGNLPGNELDISAIMRRGPMAKPKPFIVNTQPVYVGTGANAVVKAQRWKARVMQRRVVPERRGATVPTGRTLAPPPPIAPPTYQYWWKFDEASGLFLNSGTGATASLKTSNTGGTVYRSPPLAPGSTYSVKVLQATLAYNNSVDFPALVPGPTGLLVFDWWMSGMTAATDTSDRMVVAFSSVYPGSLRMHLFKVTGSPRIRFSIGGNYYDSPDTNSILTLTSWSDPMHIQWEIHPATGAWRILINDSVAGSGIKANSWSGPWAPTLYSGYNGVTGTLIYDELKVYGA